MLDFDCGRASLLHQRIAVGSQGALSVSAETCVEDLAREALAAPAFLNSEIDLKVCSSHCDMIGKRIVW